MVFLGHISQGLAGAVCFWAATLKAARGTKVSFPCYETWINKSQPFDTSDLLQVAHWRLCPSSAPRILCEIEAGGTTSSVPPKCGAWFPRKRCGWSEARCTETTSHLDSTADYFFALSFGFSFQPHMVTFLHLHHLHLASVFAVKHKAVHKSLAKLNSMSPSAHCKYVLNISHLFAHQTLTCFSQSTGDARQMSPRCLGLMLKINAWWSGAIWSPKKLFLGFSFPFGAFTLFLSGMKMYLMLLGFYLIFSTSVFPDFQQWFFLQDFACTAAPTRSQDFSGESWKSRRHLENGWPSVSEKGWL